MTDSQGFHAFDPGGTEPAVTSMGIRRTMTRNAQGFALIDVIFVCGIIGLLCSIAVPKFLLVRQSAESASAIGSMRAINSAQLTYALTCASGFYAPNLTTLGTPPPGSNEPYISPDMGVADLVQKSGYNIQLVAVPFPGGPPTCNGLGPGSTGQGFVGAADPTHVDNTRFFATNANAMIFENNSTLLGVMPELGEPPVGHTLAR
jgi:type II secretory pathway pseudopilin PulG